VYHGCTFQIVPFATAEEMGRPGIPFWDGGPPSNLPRPGLRPKGLSTEAIVPADFDTRTESQLLLRPTVCGAQKESDVMKLRNLIAFAIMLAGLALPALAADIDGQWKATFDTQIGEQHYTYTLKADGEKLTGSAKNDRGSTDITAGTIKGNTVTFVENLDFNGNQIVITYTGTLSGDELKLHRKVGDFAEEDLVAKRVK
jgi:hypothetical protein